MNIPFRPLGKAKEIIDSIGINISYAFDDLLFIEDYPIIIRFDDENPGNLFFHTDIDCNPAEFEQIRKRLTVAAKLREWTITDAGRYQIAPKEGEEELEISFL